MHQADPFFQDIPWDFIYDDNGKLIGEVYLLLSEPHRKKTNRVKGAKKYGQNYSTAKRS